MDEGGLGAADGGGGIASGGSPVALGREKRMEMTEARAAYRIKDRRCDLRRQA